MKLGKRTKLLATIMVMSFLIISQFFVLTQDVGRTTEDDEFKNAGLASETATIESDHFIVEYPSGADLMGDRVSRIAEDIYDDTTTFMNYTPNFKTTIEVNYGRSLGYAKGRSIHLFKTPYSRSDPELANHLSEEFIHVLQLEFRGEDPTAQPIWLTEGMASYVDSGYNYSEKSQHGYILNRLADRSELEKLRYMEDPSMGIDMTVYSSGYSVHVYLEEEYGQQSINQFVEGVKGWNFTENISENMDAILQDSVGLSYQEFDNQWLDWVKNDYAPRFQCEKSMDASKVFDTSFNVYPSTWSNDTIVYERFVSTRTGGKSFVHNLYQRKSDDAQGSKVTRSSASIMEEDPRFSAERDQLIYTSYLSGSAQIYRLNYSAEMSYFSDRKQLTEDSMNFDPTCSGDKIAFVSSRNGDYDIFSTDFNGSQVESLVNSDSADISPSYSPDGKKLVFSSNRDGNFDLYKLNIGEDEVKRLTDTVKDEMNPRWSPNGTKIAYEEHGKFKGGGSKVHLIDEDGDDMTSIGGENATVFTTANPTWNHNGTKLSFSVNNPEVGDTDDATNIHYTEVEYELDEDGTDGNNTDDGIDDGNNTDDGGDSSSTPGFSTISVILALLTTAAIYRRKRREKIE